MNTKITGNAGEEKASQYLIQKGYSIIARNFRTKGGEVDIIAVKDNVVVFVEVKSLPNGTPELLQTELSSVSPSPAFSSAVRFSSPAARSSFCGRFSILTICIITT